MSAGLKQAVKLANFCTGNFYGLQQRVFDCLLGVSTRGIMSTEGSVIEGCLYYQGCQWLSVRWALKYLKPSMSDVFVDLGSGKGKALLIACQLQYKRVIGVEIDKELSCWAARNIDRARPRLRAEKVECLNFNILEWFIPDDTSVIFMYNPFIGQTFSSVMSKVFESYDNNPRPLHIIYEFPWIRSAVVNWSRSCY